MKRAGIRRIGEVVQLAMLIAAFALVGPNWAYAQNGSGSGTKVPCMVNYLRVRIATGGDDLRGWNGMSTSKDNLDITVNFGKQGSQLAADVNNDKEWANNTVNLVVIKFNPAVPLNEIKGIQLRHTGLVLGISAEAASGIPGAGIETADNWDMDRVEVMAEGTGASALIARHGAKRFTGQDRILSFRTDIPANSCGVSERFGRLNPGMKNVQPPDGAGSKYGTQRPAPSTIQPASKSGSRQLQNNRLIQQALAHTVQIGPRASELGVDASRSAIIAVLKRQSATAHSLLLPAFTGGVKPASGQTNGAKGATLATAPSQSGPMLNGSGGANQTGTLLNPGTTRSLNPQPYPPKGSQPQIGASQTMSASGTQGAGPSTNPTATQVNQPSGPTAQRPPAGRQPLPPGTRAPAPITTICRTGIATVDGGANGIWFSPVAGQDGEFVIQGCGFGNTPGEVYLSGVQFDPAHARLIVQHVGVSNSPDHVYFQVPANGWGDRQIIAQIDANASGLYDTNNVTLNVKTASGQVYQATGMNFLAAREDQVLQRLVTTPYPTGSDSCYGLTLSECLVPGINLAIVNASLGPLTPEVESPTHYWLTPDKSIAVVRGVIYLNATDNYSLIFPSGTDTYQFHFAPGFQLDPNKGVQLNHATMDVSHCQSLGGVYSHSGNWGMSYTSTSSFQVHWEQEACSSSSGAAKNPQGIGNTSGYAGFSAYELEITVIGPRGINPLASGNVNGLAIKQMQPVQILKKQ
ncbi:MAG TPA: hypothetical protein VGU63_10375 [Candidatus Acidoferrales bacterium]|nr:hypothetical protein [Candidatus Acidoferrales bacterium]